MPVQSALRHASSRPNPGSSKKAKFRPDIQGLRAFAVLAVIASHLTGWPTGGFVGVDVFFVISGFLITSLLLREKERTGTISFTDFYKRRVKRILPASLLVLVATVGAAYWFLPKARAEETFVDSIWALLFAGNWRFAVGGTDYFQEGTPPSPLQHFWSLGVEEQFYFVWPWLMLLIFWFTSKRASENGRVYVGWAMGIILAASFAWAMWETANNPTWAYFSTLSRAWELGVGALVAVVSPVLTRIPGALRPVLGWVGLLGMVASVFLVDASVGFPAPWAALPVAATALVIIAGTGGPVRFMFPLTNRVSGYIGDISYSLYLWHWPVIILLVAFMPAGNVLYYVVAGGLSLALSIASYHCVEDPIRKFELAEFRRKVQKRGGVPISERTKLTLLGALTVATALVVTAALTNHPASPPPSYTAAAPLATSGTAVAKADPALCLGAASLARAAECEGKLGDSVTPSIDTFADDTGGAYKCWRQNGETFKDCTLGSTSPTAVRVAVIGDSHAASLLPALEPIAKEKGWKLDVYTGVGCQWMDLWDGSDCQHPIRSVQEKLLTDNYAAVITTAARTKTGNSPADASRRFASFWSPVAAKGTKVIAVGDVPSVSEEAIACLTRVGFKVTGNTCGTPEGEALGTEDALVAAVGVVTGAQLVDLTDQFCFGGTCPAVIGNAIVYRDTAGHVTGTYMKSLAPVLGERLAKALA